MEEEKLMKKSLNEELDEDEAEEKKQKPRKRIKTRGETTEKVSNNKRKFSVQSSSSGDDFVIPKKRVDSPRPPSPTSIRSSLEIGQPPKKRRGDGEETRALERSTRKVRFSDEIHVMDTTLNRNVCTFPSLEEDYTIYGSKDNNYDNPEEKEEDDYKDDFSQITIEDLNKFEKATTCNMM